MNHSDDFEDNKENIKDLEADDRLHDIRDNNPRCTSCDKIIMRKVYTFQKKPYDKGCYMKELDKWVDNYGKNCVNKQE